MKLSRLLRFLLAPWLPMHVVEVGGGAVVEDDEQQDDAAAGEGEQQGGESGAADEQGAESEGGTTDAAADEVVVSIGDEPAADEEEDDKRAPTWVRDLRLQNRENAKRLRQLEEENARLKGAAAPGATIVGEKPTLEGCDYDTEKFEQQLDAWKDRKRKAEDEQAQRQQAEQRARDEWQAKVDGYKKAAATLKVKDFADAEEAALSVLNQTQQGIIVSGADRAELVMYVLGKNPKKAKELASIADPVKFAFAVAKLETQLKVTARKSAPLPERTVRSTVPGATGIKDTELARLQAEADKSGDRSKVAAYLRSKQQALRAA